MHEFFNEKLKKCYADNECEAIISGLSLKKYQCIRANKLKTDSIKIAKVLDSLGIAFDFREDYDNAIILHNYVRNKGKGYDERTGISLEELPMYKNGEIYFQSLSSMKPVFVLNPVAKENILDMCAAPGSKTTMIQSITKNKSNLTACELHKDRFERLQFNCKTQGANVYLLNQNALDLDDNLKFDKILIDAPCTGTGTFDTKNENYLENFTDKLILKTTNVQKKLIKKAYKLLKQGGELVYSTCSLLKEENEDMMFFAYGLGLDTIGSYIKIMPDELFEGFFIFRAMKV